MGSTLPLAWLIHFLFFFFFFFIIIFLGSNFYLDCPYAFSALRVLLPLQETNK